MSVRYTSGAAGSRPIGIHGSPDSTFAEVAAIARQFNHAEDVVYVGLAFLLAVSAGALLGTTGIELWKSILGGTPLKGIVSLLDRLLLILNGVTQ